MTGIVVVMCGISGKDARMVEIVVSRAPNLKHQYQLVQAANATRCDIALVDAQAPTAVHEISALRTRFGNVPAVYVSDDGSLGVAPYRIARRSLLLQVLRTFDEVVAVTARSPASASAQVAKPISGAASATAAAPAPVEPAKLEALSALVVDDSLTVRTQLQGALDRIGVKAQLAENGQSAMEAVHKRRFDVIFLDVVMPGMDGYALCRQIKSSPTTRATPVVMLTSRSSPFDRARGALAGCDTYLTKPIDLKTFYKAIEKALLKAFKDDRKLMSDRGYKFLAL